MNRILTRPIHEYSLNLLSQDFSPHLVNECKKNILRKLRTFYKKKKSTCKLTRWNLKNKAGNS